MATPPTFVAEYETVWNVSTTPKTVTPTTAAGDILAIAGITADEGTALTTPTGNSLTYTLQQSVVVAAYTAAYGWTAPDAVGGTGWTLSVGRTGNDVNFWGFTALRFSGSDGVGASAKTNVASGAPSLDITTTQDNSAIVVLVGDWAAVDGASRTWRTVNGTTPTAANGFERSYFRDAAQYTIYVAYYPDAGAAGVKTVGLSAPGGQKYSIIAIEVQGVAGAAPAADTSYVPLNLRWLIDQGLWRPIVGGIESAAAVAEEQIGTVGEAPTGTATEVKVAVVTGVCSVGLAGAGTGLKVSVTQGPAAAAVAGTATEKKVAAQVGTAAAAVIGTGLESAGAVEAELGTAVAAPIATSTERKVAVQTGFCSTGAVGSAADAKKAVSTGSCTAGTVGRATQGTADTRQQTGLCGLGAGGTSTARKVAVHGGHAATTHAPRGTQSKRAASVGRSCTAPIGTGLDVHRALQRGLVAAGLIGLVQTVPDANALSAPTVTAGRTSIATVVDLAPASTPTVTARATSTPSVSDG